MKNLNKLVEASEELTKLSDENYPGHKWSVVKLLLLGGWSYVYTTIIPKHFAEYWYVDLLAGPGTTKVKETGDVVAGSPFVAHFFARSPYKRYVLSDKKESYCGALKLRAKHVLGPSASVIREDCNRFARTVASRAEAKKHRVHFFAFLDNEGLDARWGAVEALLGAKCDLMINFPTVGARRVLGAAKGGGERGARALTEFFGDEAWRNAGDEEDLLRIYLERLETEFRRLREGRRPYVSSVRIGEERYHYDIVLVCKHGPYVRAWEYLKERLEWKSPEIVKHTLDILRGRTRTIDWFFGLQEETEKIAGGEGKQTLEKFFGQPP